MLAHLRAQAGLEYLLTYGWAMVLVVTVASLFFFVFSVPGKEKVNFSAGGRQIIVKASDIAGCAGKDSAILLLQNASGGPITITSVYGNGAFFESGSSAIAVDGVQPPVVVAAGRQIRLEKIDAVCGMIDGGISIDYTDKDGYQRTEKIRGVGRISCCPGHEECPEQTEQSCNDLLDNDCDSKFDCDDPNCSAKPDCELYCTTNDARFPVKGGIEFVVHQSQATGDCLDWQVGGSAIFLKNLSGQTVVINNASVSLGTSYFDYYAAGNCGFLGHFYSGENCGYYETFAVQSFNGKLGEGENCNIDLSSAPGEEMQIGISNFDFCADDTNPTECLSPINDYDAMLDVLRAHKSNPITLSLNTSVGIVNIYCYNFPA